MWTIEVSVVFCSNFDRKVSYVDKNIHDSIVTSALKPYFGIRSKARSKNMEKKSYLLSG
jgi:hypothetical protein